MPIGEGSGRRNQAVGEKTVQSRKARRGELTEVEKFLTFRDGINSMTVPEEEEYDPEWKTVTSLVSETGSREKSLWQLMEKFLADKKDKTVWLKRRPAANNSKRLHLHPTLVSFIRETCGKREKAPEGWKTVAALAGIFGVDNETVEKEVKPYREKHPEWFGPYLDENGSEREHLHPDVEYILSMVFESREEKAPEGWRTNTRLWTELTKMYPLDKQTVQAIATEKAWEHPDWVKPYLTPEGKFVPHYHPDLVVYIWKEVERTKKKRSQ